MSTSTFRPRRARAEPVRGLSPGEWSLVGTAIAFVAISVWWVAVDARVTDADNAKHLLSTFGMYDGLAAGHPRFPLYVDTGYPPLVYLVGAAGVLIGGATRAAAILAENVVFVPLLVGGCYAAGRIAYDRATGVLAALFALAVPMVISLFHVMMLDAPMAALVAATVALLMASERLARTRLALLAGVAFGLGALTKQTFVLFVAGFLLVMLVRGGWRNWKGLIAFAAAAVVIAAPWYLEHASDVASTTEGVTAAAPPVWFGTVTYPERWSFDNFTWYGWALANNTLYLPLLLMFVVGLGFAVRRLLRSAERGWEPELLAGAVVSYGAISLFRLDDPRYLLPWLVYVALISTAWMRELPRPGRLAATAALAAVLIVNTIVQNFGLGSEVRLSLWDHTANPLSEGALVILSPHGYVVGEPERGENPVRPLLEAARADGARRVAFDTQSATEAGFHTNGLAVEARAAGLDVAGYDPSATLGPRDVYFFMTRPQGGAPCASTGTRAIYLTRGGPPGPDNPVWCPRSE